MIMKKAIASQMSYLPCQVILLNIFVARTQSRKKSNFDRNVSSRSAFHLYPVKQDVAMKNMGTTKNVQSFQHKCHFWRFLYIFQNEGPKCLSLTPVRIYVQVRTIYLHSLLYLRNAYDLISTLRNYIGFYVLERIGVTDITNISVIKNYRN